MAFLDYTRSIGSALQKGTQFLGGISPDTIRREVPFIFEQNGWRGTVYLINGLYYSGIRSFDPPQYRMPSVYNLSNDLNFNDEEMTVQYYYSPNHTRPIGRVYKPKPKAQALPPSESGSMVILRDDYLGILNQLQSQGSRLEEDGINIIELIASGGANPLKNTLTLYKGVKIVSMKEQSRNQGDLFYTVDIGLYFPSPAEIYNLESLIPITL